MNPADAIPIEHNAPDRAGGDGMELTPLEIEIIKQYNGGNTRTKAVEEVDASETLIYETGLAITKKTGYKLEWRNKNRVKIPIEND